ncbi:hypothetical protein AB0H86_11905 [Streptomyces sp. NPDC050997]
MPRTPPVRDDNSPLDLRRCGGPLIQRNRPDHQAAVTVWAHPEQGW